MSDTRVYEKNGKCYLQTAYRLVNLCKAIPGFRKWVPAMKAWEFKPASAALRHIERSFPDADWDTAMKSKLAKLQQQEMGARQNRKEKNIPDDQFEVNDFKFKTQPFAHQAKAFMLSRDKKSYALLMEQGTGKTKVIIDTAAYLYAKGEINALLVVAPNGVKTNWVLDELPVHMPDYINYRAAYWNAQAKREERKRMEAVTLDVTDDLRILVMNVEAFSTKKGSDYAKQFLLNHKAMMVVDESTRIKSPGASRTKSIIRAGQYAKYRRILTGTPVTQSPMDLYAQFKFLDEDILGYSSFYAFRNRYAIMGGYQGREVCGYQYLDELQNLVDGHSFRVLKEDCLDLPPKLYQRRYYSMSPEYEKAYSEMKDILFTEIDGQEFDANIALTKMLRLQQIATRDPARLSLMMDEIEAVNGKVIIWSRFVDDIERIIYALEVVYGKGCAVGYYGAVDNEQRTKNRQAFQDPDSKVRFFVGQQHTGGIGLTLTQAKTVIYYSNDFSLETRLQSEDRAHRIGQTENVTYIDLQAENTLDKHIIGALRGKKNLADEITGDVVKGWLAD